jgi:hypothetical protein
MDTFKVILFITALCALYVVINIQGKKDSFSFDSSKPTTTQQLAKQSTLNKKDLAERIAFEKWADRWDNLRDRWAATLKDEAKRVHNKVQALNAKMFQDKLKGKPLENKVEQLTPEERKQNAANIAAWKEYINTKQTQMKCDPRLWLGKDHDPSKYWYVARVKNETSGSWRCPFTDSTYIYLDTGCSWDDKDNGNYQCAVMTSDDSTVKIPNRKAPQPVPITTPYTPGTPKTPKNRDTKQGAK